MNSQTRSARPSPSRPVKTASPAIRILLADDHPVIRIGVRNMLQSEEGLEVVGECSDGDEAITQTSSCSPTSFCSMSTCRACLALKPCAPS